MMKPASLLPLFLMGILVGCDKLNLASHSEDHPQGAAPAETIYTCPMHPEVRLTDPNASCPICKMDLVPAQSQKSQTGPTEENLKSAHIQTGKVELKDKVSFEFRKVGNATSANRVSFFMTPEELSQIQAQTSVVLTHGPAGEKTPGQIVFQASSADPASRRVRLDVLVKSGKAVFIPETEVIGLFANELTNALVLPETAIGRDHASPYVYKVLKSGRLQKKNLEIGPLTPRGRVVLKGLKAGDEVSLGPNFLIDSESRIQGGEQDQNEHGHHHHH